MADAELPRLYKDRAGNCPYVKDLFAAGMRKADAQPDDILVYINQDVCVRSDAALLLASWLQETDACYSYRRDFHADFDKPLPDSEIPKGDDLGGCDLFAFRVSWWLAHRDKMPDMLVGREAWDAVFRTLIDATNPSGKTPLHNLIYHRRHYSTWERTENRHDLPSQHYNIGLAKDFCRRHGIDGRPWGLL